MRVKKSYLKQMIKEIYFQEKKIYKQEESIRSIVRNTVNNFLKEFEDKNNNGIPDEWEKDPNNPMNMSLKTSFGKDATIRSILKNPEHPDYKKAKALLDRKRNDTKLQKYVSDKYGEEFEIGQEIDDEGPTPPGGQQTTPSTSAAADDEEEDRSTIFNKSGDDQGEVPVSPEDDLDKDPSYIYGDTGEDQLSVPFPPFARDLPTFWKKLASRGEEDQIASGKRASTFVFKTKKRQKGARITPGGES
tara:strand:+ start:1004 stop:1741 length:738 start_codon:yes stop_codon:yes gene_type:complete